MEWIGDSSRGGFLCFGWFGSLEALGSGTEVGHKKVGEKLPENMGFGSLGRWNGKKGADTGRSIFAGGIKRFGRVSMELGGKRLVFVGKKRDSGSGLQDGRGEVSAGEEQRECMKVLMWLGEKTSAKWCLWRQGGSCREIGAIGGFFHSGWGREGRRRNKWVFLKAGRKWVKAKLLQC